MVRVVRVVELDQRLAVGDSIAICIELAGIPDAY